MSGPRLSTCDCCGLSPCDAGEDCCCGGAGCGGTDCPSSFAVTVDWPEYTIESSCDSSCSVVIPAQSGSFTIEDNVPSVVYPCNCTECNLNGGVFDITCNPSSPPWCATMPSCWPPYAGFPPGTCFTFVSLMFVSLWTQKLVSASDRYQYEVTVRGALNNLAVYTVDLPAESCIGGGINDQSTEVTLTSITNYECYQIDPAGVGPTCYMRPSETVYPTWTIA